MKRVMLVCMGLVAMIALTNTVGFSADLDTEPQEYIYEGDFQTFIYTGAMPWQPFAGVTVGVMDENDQVLVTGVTEIISIPVPPGKAGNVVLKFKGKPGQHLNCFAEKLPDHPRQIDGMKAPLPDPPPGYNPKDPIRLVQGEEPNFIFDGTKK